jgi:hypothetical protein
MIPEIKKYGSNLVVRPNSYSYDEKLQANLLNGVLVVNQFEVQGSTQKTDSIESSDPDEILGATVITENVEPTDPDEISAGATEVTAVQEQADPDEIFLGSTEATKAVESSDPDEWQL